MKRIGVLCVAGALAMAATGCVASPRQALFGGIYTGAQAGENAGAGQGGAKTGEACSMSILSLVHVGDASIKAAMKDGGVTQVTAVDNDIMSILGIYAKYCTVVTGN